MKNIIRKIFELNELTREVVKKYPKKRFLFNIVRELKSKHFKGIVGPRGSGKTVLLEQLSVYFKDSVYISMDTLEPDSNLFDIVKNLNLNYKIKNFFIDEIHFNRDYKKSLKNIFDFLDVNLFFSSSVSISTLDSSYDLSRRIKFYYLYPFSLREYLFFKKDVLLEPLSLKDIIQNDNLEYLRYEYLFDEYLKGGNYPISLEESDITEPLENILKKIIFKDIASSANLGFGELHTVENLLKFIGRSHAEDMSYTNIAKNIGISKYKAIKYLQLLEKSFVLNIVFPKGTNVLKEPKILMRVPYRLLYNDFENAIGYIKEDFFADMMKYGDIEFYYLKTKRGKKTPDFLIKYEDKEFIFEIGGKSKDRKQFKGIETKNKYVFAYPHIPEKNQKPLFLIGFLK